MGIRNNFAQQFTPTCQFLHALTMPLKYIGYTLKHMIAVNTVSVNQFVYRRWKDTATNDMLEVIRLVYATGCLGPGHRLTHRFNVGVGKDQSDPVGSAVPSL